MSTLSVKRAGTLPTSRNARSFVGSTAVSATRDLHQRDTTGAQWEKLMEMELRPVATPQIARAFKQSDTADLANIHLLVHPSEPASWPELLNNPQLELLRSKPMLTFESYSTLFQAAVNGLGIAFAPVQLFEAELSSKRLVPIMDFAIKARSVGYLVYPRENGGYLPLQAFRTWLLKSIEESQMRAPH
jgi:DNA-binding transcriptional LysR family regulator